MVYKKVELKQIQKNLLISSFFCIICVVLIIVFIDNQQKKSYAKVVGEYSDTSLTNLWANKGEAYSIGMNAKGRPVFKDLDAAFEQAQVDFSKGFAYLYQYKKLPKLSKRKSVWKQYHKQSFQANPPMTVPDYEEIGEQCRWICAFFSIYADSFNMDYNL